MLFHENVTKGCNPHSASQRQHYHEWLNEISLRSNATLQAMTRANCRDGDEPTSNIT
jgi:hypothetical protein